MVWVYKCSKKPNLIYGTICSNIIIYHLGVHAKESSWGGDKIGNHVLSRKKTSVLNLGEVGHGVEVQWGKG